VAATRGSWREGKQSAEWGGLVRSLALSYNPPRYISRASGRCQLLDPRGGVQRAVGCAARVRRLKSSVPHCVAIFGVGTVCGAPQECAHSNRTAILRLVPPFEGVPAPNPPPVGAVRSHHLQLGPRGGRGARRGAVGPRFPPACPVLPLVHPKSICTYSNKSTVVLAVISTGSIISIVVL
jgi:hypothetical protein